MKHDRKSKLRDGLAEVRSRTLSLFDAVPDSVLKLRVHSFYSPVGWHFGHIARTEQHWVSQACADHPQVDPHLDFLFTDRPDNPKDNRIHLPGRAAIIDYLSQTRNRTIQALEDADLNSADPMLQDGYAWEFAMQHECQHQETICELLQLIQKEAAVVSASDSPLSEPKLTLQDPNWNWFEVSANTATIGTLWVHAYDNEKPIQQIRMHAFRIATSLVTAGQWLGFVRDGGYARPELWTGEGWAWRCHEQANTPEYWMPTADGYLYTSAQGTRPIDPSEAVTSISWYEADAFAQWCGCRLPTEFEWEVTARTNLSRGWFSQAWQWTSSPFLPYPGFRPFPYDGYSKVHMDGRHYVCRGGSWATSPRMHRCSFRNWYVPTYRQGFLSLRLAL